MEQSSIQDEIKSSRRQRRFNLIALLVMLSLGLLNFSLVKAALPVLNSIGPQGMTGTIGQQGIEGSSGNQGMPGLQGVAGSQGNTGATGATGMTGPAGSEGSTGAQGVQGDTGSPGDPGQPGRLREQRCVQNDLTPRLDYRYEGDTVWQPDYYLPTGSTCP